MSKNFELIKDDAITFEGRTLYRIRALVDYPNGHAKKGDIGGYIESEDTLSDWAWIADDAKVYDAFVYGDAKISHRACIYYTAYIGGDAYISNPLDVLCFPSVYGTRRIFTFFRTKDGGIGFSDGIAVMTLQQFVEKVNDIKNTEHPIYKEYLAIISYVKIRFGVQ